MEVSPDDFRRLYSSLSDIGLRTIQRDDLTDIARQCYDQELASRGLSLTPAEVEPDPDEPAGDAADMVELATFTSYEEGKLARAMLASAEIPSYLEDLRSSIGAAMRLFVPAEFLEQAQEILESELSDEELARQAEAEIPPEE
jgi:Putative prokaryotic signal transducing protein